MGKFSRDKGARVERNIVNILNENGIEAERVPLSGSVGGSFTKDISLDFLAARQPFEVKARANGFLEIHKWLPGARGLFLKTDKKETLVVLRISDFMPLLKAANEATRARVWADADMREAANDNVAQLDLLRTFG